MRNTLPILFIAIILVGTLIFTTENLSNEPLIEKPLDTNSKNIFSFLNSLILIIFSYFFIVLTDNIQRRTDRKISLLKINYLTLNNSLFTVLIFNILAIFTLLPPDLDFVLKIISWALLGALTIQVTFFIVKNKGFLGEHEKNVKKLVNYIENSSDINHSKHELLKNGWAEEIVNEAIIKTLKLEHDAIILIKKEKKLHHKKIDVKHELLMAGWDEQIIDKLIKRYW
jgi:hypothetical protein